MSGSELPAVAVITVNYNGKPKSRSAVWFDVVEGTAPSGANGLRAVTGASGIPFGYAFVALVYAALTAAAPSGSGLLCRSAF